MPCSGFGRPVGPLTAQPPTPSTVSLFTELECGTCSTRHDARRLLGSSSCCDDVLLARYDLDAARERIHGRDVSGLFTGSGLWRYAALLPDAGPQGPVTLGEGGTPLLASERLAREDPVTRLWLKDESRNPTGTFKARGMSLAVTRARALGATRLCVPTAGNAGGALAAYAARAGLEAIVAMPRDAPAANKTEVRAAGARLIEVDGLLPACAAQLAADPGAQGAFPVTTLREPYRLEGKKTMGFELWEQLGGRFPDVILFPTGGGVGIIALRRAHAELAALGLVDERPPRLVAVQAEGCAPLATALREGAERARSVPDARTLAGGLRVPAPRGDRLVLRDLRATGGSAVTVTEDALVAGMQRLARMTGLIVSPEAGAAYAGIAALRAEGGLDADEEVAVFLTGSGLKHLDLF